MVRNFVSNPQFYCINGHEKPILMQERERTDDTKDDFFACPKYMQKDEKHPDGYGEGERGCTNRLSFSDAANILLEFNKIVEEDMQDDMIVDYTNLTFNYKQIKVTVLKYGSDTLWLGIYNKRAIES